MLPSLDKSIKFISQAHLWISNVKMAVMWHANMTVILIWDHSNFFDPIRRMIITSLPSALLVLSQHAPRTSRAISGSYIRWRKITMPGGCCALDLCVSPKLSGSLHEWSCEGLKESPLVTLVFSHFAGIPKTSLLFGGVIQWP